MLKWLAGCLVSWRLPHARLCPLEATMAKPLPRPVWDRQRGTLGQEWMDDHQPHYEKRAQCSFTQWVSRSRSDHRSTLSIRTRA